jgi:hypothetical protein
VGTPRVDHLELCGIEWARKPPAAPHSTPPERDIAAVAAGLAGDVEFARGIIGIERADELQANPAQNAPTARSSVARCRGDRLECPV